VKILPRLEDPRSVLQFAALTGENDAVPAIRGSL
jgi:hypothetical protein